MKYLILLIAMLFCHIVDDYYLQGWLASAKQKKWWEDNAPDDLYKNDYKMALIEHAFSWACSIHIPILVFGLLHPEVFGVGVFFVVCEFVLVWLTHAWVDNLKANKHEINLIQDQLIHIVQVVGLWGVYLFFGIVR